MTKPNYILTHDIGTTSNKTCLYKIDDHIKLVESDIEEYALYTLPNGGVEQKAEEWWAAICCATKNVLQRSGVSPAEIRGMAFCAQMQGFIPVAKDGNVLRNPMSYMDHRATAQIEKGLHHGFPRINGWNAYKTLRSVQITGGLSASVKDPVWKYWWMRENEPEQFAQLYKWLDVNDYLIMRCTGKFTMGVDSAHATFMCDTRPNKVGWHEGICKMFAVDMEHLPSLVQATDVVGSLTKEAAEDLGLVEGIPVFGGGGDLSLISVGAGCFDLYDTHIYTGTSGWVVSTVDKRMTDIGGMVASILGAIPGWYNYIAEQETAGRCLQWVRDHLALDEIGIYLQQNPSEDEEEMLESLYELLNREISQVPAGANGVIFTPWLHGNRSPFEDPFARGMFFNIGLETGKRELIRAVLEGVAYHQRWMLEQVETRIPYQATVRFVGGGAQSGVWAQILADVTGRRIEVIENAQNVGTVGAAIVCAVGLGILHDFQDAASYIRVDKVFEPQATHQAVYERNFTVYKALYKQNKTLFRKLNKKVVT